VFILLEDDAMHLKYLERVVSFARDEEAATAVEYAVMLAFITAVVIVAVGALGIKTTGLFSDFNSDFNNSLNPP
jgi:Flp pilus assembly pilin Flp